MDRMTAMLTGVALLASVIAGESAAQPIRFVDLPETETVATTEES